MRALYKIVEQAPGAQHQINSLGQLAIGSNCTYSGPLDINHILSSQSYMWVQPIWAHISVIQTVIIIRSVGHPGTPKNQMMEDKKEKNPSSNFFRKQLMYAFLTVGY